MENMDIMKEYYEAMREDRIKAYYQPVYHIEESCLVSAEALCRIMTRDGKIITPDSFIPILERTGEICALDWHMIDRACAMAFDIIAETVSDIRIAVNFSRYHVNEWDAVEHLCSIVDSYFLDHDRIEIEITESYRARDYLLNDMMQKLRSGGFHVAVDDFGNGESTLKFIKGSCFDTIKIDRSFIEGLGKDNSGAIIRGISGMAKDLGIRTVAEGVETLDQAVRVVCNGCVSIQGNYLSGPIPEDMFIDYILKEEEKTTDKPVIIG